MDMGSSDGEGAGEQGWREGCGTGMDGGMKRLRWGEGMESGL